jgi:hypothetical protein
VGRLFCDCVSGGDAAQERGYNNENVLSAKERGIQFQSATGRIRRGEPGVTTPQEI